MRKNQVGKFAADANGDAKEAAPGASVEAKEDPEGVGEPTGEISPEPGRTVSHLLSLAREYGREVREGTAGPSVNEVRDSEDISWHGPDAETMTMGEAAKVLGRDAQQLRRLCSAGVLRFVWSWPPERWRRDRFGRMLRGDRLPLAEDVRALAAAGRRGVTINRSSAWVAGATVALDRVAGMVAGNRLQASGVANIRAELESGSDETLDT